MLGAHLSEFKDSLGKYSEERGERFYQDVADYENDTKNRCNAAQLGEFDESLVWSLIKVWS